VWIAPEGTRSRTGEIGSLKKGGFLLAQETGTPILPVALRGTRDVLPPDTVRIQHGAHVDVTFGEPIEVEGASVEQLMEKVRGFLTEHVE
jgi:1-acyl-sn-glycerol-3-phosphate acyltransferase